MIEPLQVFVGFDTREERAYRVAVDSLLRHASVPVRVTPLRLSQLELTGLCTRPRRRLEWSSQVWWDEVSGAPMATEFAVTRFLTPLLAQTGWALFVDCDVVFLGDVAELFAGVDPNCAVACVQHASIETKAVLKMDGQVQTSYPRKNWSSVCLFNCDHPANLALTLARVNSSPGRDLHAFNWLQENQLAALPAEWNWLVGVQSRPATPKLAHFTLGGPWLPNWKASAYDDIWLSAESCLE